MILKNLYWNFTSQAAFDACGGCRRLHFRRDTKFSIFLHHTLLPQLHASNTARVNQPMSGYEFRFNYYLINYVFWLHLFKFKTILFDNYAQNSLRQCSSHLNRNRRSMVNLTDWAKKFFLNETASIGNFIWKSHNLSI